MDSRANEREADVIMNYSVLLDSLLSSGKNPCWLVVKDEKEHSFSILGIGFHDLDLMFLYKKLQEQKYVIQINSPPIEMDDGSTVSFNSVKNSFLNFGYNWENPESLLCRLLEIIKN
ncbi:hypothetical protein [Sphaerochaeta sp. S2]|uniref:hypothetical protein n=1 Tax=Sphaerochaeta sp. S2 TaxID=2798868 RepID=UPI0018E92E39|nr:hypothetical protein [Sphaerochaeta sp. S2]MBJ2357863.1 hypothetical protein [Sphaerochaeta sp. S2]